MDPQPDQSPTLPLETLTLGSSTTTIDNPLSLAIRFTTPADLCYDLASLHDLACRGQWLSVLDKVARARSLSLLPAPHHHLVYLAFRLLSLYKLRRYRDASDELAQLGGGDGNDDLDSPRFRYDSYPDLYPGRSGSMLPFAVRFVRAELPQHLGELTETLERLYSLLDLVRVKIDAGDYRSEQWRRREAFLLASIFRHHFSHREFDVCLLLLRDLLAKRPSDPVLLSRLGYVQMQIGNLDGSKASFLRVEALRDEHGGEVEFENLVGRNRALGFVAAKDYRSAVSKYEECIERDPADVVAINNKALCLMYSRDLSDSIKLLEVADSIKLLEAALERVPTAAVNETLTINVCNGMSCGETFVGPNSPNKPSLWTENWTSQLSIFWTMCVLWRMRCFLE